MGRYSEAMVRDAEAIDKQLRFIRHFLRQAFAPDEGMAALTAPQTNVMAALAKNHQRGRGAMTIRSLCQEVGLSQSTISGIVARLESKGLVSREVGSSDKRQTLVRIAEPVNEYLESALPDRRLQPLLRVLARAKADEKKVILDGVAALHALLQAQANEAADAAECCG